MKASPRCQHWYISIGHENGGEILGNCLKDGNGSILAYRFRIPTDLLEQLERTHDTILDKRAGNLAGR